MAQAKTLVKALQPFAHGNVSAQAGRVYAMNKADADGLVNAGFAEAVTEGDPEQTQIDQQPQAKHKGDVVVDDADDLLGDGKAAPELENKAARPASSKTPAKGK